MLTFTSAQLAAWIAAFIWPLTRLLGMFAVAPIFGNRAVPAPIKIGLGVAVTVLVAPLVGEIPAVDPMSLAGILILAQQLLIGLAMGFTVRVIFAGFEMAGELIGMTMGLGFASFFDPISQGRSTPISQFLVLLSTLIFLAADFHLNMIEAMLTSFKTIPIGGEALGSNTTARIAIWGAQIFTVGLQLSIPVVAALLVTNAALALLTRAAPQLNIFGIGFPITISVGLLMVGITLPYLASPIVNNLQAGIAQIGSIGVAHLK